MTTSWRSAASGGSAGCGASSRARSPRRSRRRPARRTSRWRDRVTAGTPHPLDPLTAGEFRRVAAVLRRERGVGEGWRFASVELAEPAKAALRAAPAPPRREALAVCWNTGDGQAYRAVVSLADGTVA